MAEADRVLAVAEQWRAVAHATQLPAPRAAAARRRASAVGRTRPTAGTATRASTRGGGEPAQGRRVRNRRRPRRSRPASAAASAARPAASTRSCARAASSPASTKPRSAAAGPAVASSRSTSPTRSPSSSALRRLASPCRWTGVAAGGALLQPPAQALGRGPAVRAGAADHVGGEREALGVEAVEAPRRQRPDAVQRGERRAERAQRRPELGGGMPSSRSPASGSSTSAPSGSEARQHARHPQVRVGGADRGRGGLRRWRARARRRPSGP